MHIAKNAPLINFSVAFTISHTKSKVAMFFVSESLIALKGFTIFSLFCLCPLLRAVAGVQRSSQLLFTSF